MNRRDALTLALGFGLLVGAGAYAAARFRLSSEITRLLPPHSDARLAAISRAFADSELSRVMIVSVEGTDADAVPRAASRLADSLRRHREVRWVRNGIEETTERAVYDLYFPRRHDLLSDAPEDELPARLSDAGLTASARELRRQLSLPTGALVARIADADPLLAFPSLLERLRRMQTRTLELRGGQFTTPDGRRAVIFVATRHSAYDASRQGPLLRELNLGFEAIQRAEPTPLALKMSSISRIAATIESSARRDAERVSVFSTAAIAALFLVVHRSLRYLALAALPIAAGTVLAAAVGLAAFGSLHGLTLAFGASLIGVCFDYPVYYINHYTLRPDPGGPRPTLDRIWKGLRLGAMTTMGGLSGLAWTEFPALREIALFSTVGVLGALATTRFLLPPLMPREPIPVRLQRRWAEGLLRLVVFVRARPALGASLAALAFAVCLAGLPRVRWVDDARALSHIHPATLREDEEVRASVSSSEPGRFVVALGDTDEAALRHNDRVYTALAELRRAGAIREFQSIHTLLWSRDLQLRNRAQVARSERLAERVEATFTREGFRPGALERFQASLRAAPTEPLTFRALASSPLADLARPFRIEPGGRVGYLTFLSGVRDGAALGRAFARDPATVYFDQGEFLRATYGRFRRRTLELTATGLAVVYALIFSRYRRARAAFAAFVPPVLAAATTLALLGLAGAELTMLHLLGLLLVLSMGADYGIFVTETTHHPEASAETLLSVTIACISAVLSFGLLGLSETPALRAVGVTTGIGMTLSLLFAPLSQSLLHARERRP